MDAAALLAEQLRISQIAVVGYEIACDAVFCAGPAVTITSDEARNLARRIGVDADAEPADVALIHAFGEHDRLADLSVQAEHGNVRIGKLTREATAAILALVGRECR